MPIPAGPLPTPTVTRPTAGTVTRPVAGTGLPGDGDNPALTRARRTAEQRMVDQCTIRRRTGETTDDDGNITPTYGPDLYSGKCRIQQTNAQAAQADVGEDYVLLLRLEVHLPMSVTGLEVGDEVTVTASQYDPDLPGRVFIVRDLALGTQKTARRVGVTERTS